MSPDYEELEFFLKHIHVTCAIIENEGLVLAAQRSERMSLPLKWEFPGGKIYPGEKAKDCLQRELLEELNIQVGKLKRLPTSTHSYQTFTVTLYPFICSIASGEILLHEHATITWLPPEELPKLDWAEADLPVVETYLSKREACTR